MKFMKELLEDVWLPGMGYITVGVAYWLGCSIPTGHTESRCYAPNSIVELLECYTPSHTLCALVT